MYTPQAPKIQRLVTPATLRHRRRLEVLAKRRYAKAVSERKAYRQMLAQIAVEKKAAKKAAVEQEKARHEKKLAMRAEAKKQAEAAAKKAAKKAEPVKKAEAAKKAAKKTGKK